ncbi:hypothetical protein AALA54_04295 [Oscillospiraceae bacterium 44-34]
MKPLGKEGCIASSFSAFAAAWNTKLHMGAASDQDGVTLALSAIYFALIVDALTSRKN